MAQSNLLKRKISTLFNNAEYSELTLTTSDGSTYHAHLNILSRFTDFFTKALSPNSGFTEAATKTVNFPEHSPASVKAFMEFCYTDEYTDADKNGKKTAQLDLEAHILAEYPIADDLKEFSVERVKGKIAPKSIGKLAFKKVWDQDMAGIVDTVYATTAGGVRNDDIRKVVVDAVVHGLSMEMFTLELLEGPIKAYIDFTAVVLTRVADGNKQEGGWSAAACGTADTAKADSGSQHVQPEMPKLWSYNEGVRTNNNGKMG